jgi:hypothetical protein
VNVDAHHLQSILPTGEVTPQSGEIPPKIDEIPPNRGETTLKAVVITPRHVISNPMVFVGSWLLTHFTFKAIRRRSARLGHLWLLHSPKRGNFKDISPAVQAQ